MEIGRIEITKHATYRAKERLEWNREYLVRKAPQAYVNGEDYAGRNHDIIELPTKKGIRRRALQGIVFVFDVDKTQNPSRITLLTIYKSNEAVEAEKKTKPETKPETEPERTLCCLKCGVIYPPSHFSLDGRTATGYKKICNKCAYGEPVKVEPVKVTEKTIPQKVEDDIAIVTNAIEELETIILKAEAKIDLLSEKLEKLNTFKSQLNEYL